MEKKIELTAVIEREGDSYVSLCPELDIASQGETIELARTNLIEALELFFEAASKQEIASRLHDEVLMHKELKMGTLRSIIRQSGISKEEFSRELD